VSEALRAAGFDVHISTSVPNYPTGVVPPGYRASRGCRERIDGFSVTRAPVYPSHDHRALGRIANYMTFAVGSSWVGRHVLATADVSLVWATPATVGMPALVATLRHGTPYVLWVQDLWPDSVFATQFLTHPVVRRAAEAGLNPYLRALYSKAAHVVAITPGMRTTLIERGVPESKASVVYNWVDETVMRPERPNGWLRTAAGVPDGGFVMVFAGNMGSGQGLGDWVDAMVLVRDLADTHLVFLGTGSDRAKLEARVADLGLDSVHFVDPVPVTEVSEMVADADVSVLSLADEPLFHITTPSKTQAALAQGKAIICSAPGETSDVVRAAGAGWLAAPANVESIAQAIREARATSPEEIARRGEAGRRYYMANMSREVGAERLAAILRTAKAEGKRSR
jgi:glycosyltransferase involved in cell wall biosynthesis